MTRGQHTLQLASYIGGDVLLESPKSASLTITVSGRRERSVTAGAITASAAAEGRRPRRRAWRPRRRSAMW